MCGGATPRGLHGQQAQAGSRRCASVWSRDSHRPSLRSRDSRRHPSLRSHRRCAGVWSCCVGACVRSRGRSARTGLWSCRCSTEFQLWQWGKQCCRCSSNLWWLWCHTSLCSGLWCAGRSCARPHGVFVWRRCQQRCSSVYAHVRWLWWHSSCSSKAGCRRWFLVRWCCGGPGRGGTHPSIRLRRGHRNCTCNCTCCNSKLWIWSQHCGGSGGSTSAGFRWVQLRGSGSSCAAIGRRWVLVRRPNGYSSCSSCTCRLCTSHRWWV
jgi:hypothetical protein